MRGKGTWGEGFCILARLFVCIGGGEKGLKEDPSLDCDSRALS